MSDKFEFEGLIDNTNLSVLIKGPEWGDAKFYGEWLLAAAKAESLWKEALEDYEFEKQVDRICSVVIHDFGLTATNLLMQLREDKTRFVFPVDRDEFGEAFTMMVGMGFFVRKYRSYQMTLPSNLSAKKVRAAVLEFAKTEDEDYVLHVEHLVTTMPFAEAASLHNLLRAVDKFHGAAADWATKLDIQQTAKILVFPKARKS